MLSFIDILITHYPAIQVVSPLLAACLCLLLRNKSFHILTITFLINFSLAIYHAVYKSNQDLLYSFGNWLAPYGIEYRLFNYSLLALIILNLITLLTIILNHNFIRSLILKFIENDKRFLFYSMILINYAGSAGIILTNDIFHLYVCIEISALTSYCLISLGDNKKSVISALDYLIMGTIGASFILISIGFIYSQTGSLNIGDIHQNLPQASNNLILLAIIGFMIIGVLLKLALFPMHLWMIRAYQNTSSIIISYVSNISYLLGIFILISFIYRIIGTEYFYQTNFTEIFKLTGLIAIFIGSFFAIFQQRTINIIIYSSLSQVGYIIFLLAFNNKIFLTLALIMVAVDIFVKLGLLLMHAQSETNNFVIIPSKLLIYIIATSASLPLTISFINKLDIINLNFDNYFYIGIIISSSVFSLIYNFKILANIYFPENNVVIKDSLILKSYKISLFIINIILFSIMIYYKEIYNYLLLTSNNF